MSLELKIHAGATGKESIDGIGVAISSLAEKTKLSSGDLQAWQAVVKGAADQGYSLSKSIDVANKTFAQGSVSLKAFTSGIKEQISEMKRAEDQAKATEGRYSRLATLLGARASGLSIPLGAQGAIGGLGMGVAGAAVTAGMVGIMASWAKAQGDAARETGNLAEKTGLSIRETQLFSKAAGVAGVSVGSLVAAVRGLSKGLAEGGDDGKKQREALDKLGIAYEDSLHRILPVQQILEQIGQKFKALGAGAERDLFATTIFGRGGLELVPLLSRLKELESEVGKFGGVMSDQGVASLTAYAERWDLLAQRVGTVKRFFTEPWVAVFLAATGGGPQPKPATPPRNSGGMVGLDPTTGRPYTLSGSSLMDDYAARDNNLAFDKYKQQLHSGGTRRDYEAELVTARKDRTALPEPFQGNTAAGQNDERIKALKASDAKIAGLQATIDGLQKQKTLAAEVASYGKAMSERELLPIQKIFAERDDLVKKGANLGTVSDFALTGATGLLGKEGIDTESLVRHLGTGGAIEQLRNQRTDLEEKQASKRALETFEFQSKNMEGYSLDRFDKDTIAAFKRKVNTGDDIRKIQLGGERERIGIQSRASGSIAKSTSFDDYDAANAEYKEKITLADKLYQKDLQSSALAKDDYEKAKENAAALEQQKTAYYNAAIERQEKLIELDKQRQQQFEGFAKGAFGALTSRNPQEALRGFVLGQARDFGSTVVGNLASAFAKGPTGSSLLGGLGGLIPGQTDASGNLTSVVGKGLASTFLGKIRKPGAAATLPGGDGLTPSITSTLTPLTSGLDRAAGSIDALDTDIKTLTQAIIDPASVGAPSATDGGQMILSASGQPFQMPGALASAITAFGGPTAAGSIASSFSAASKAFGAAGGNVSGPIATGDNAGALDGNPNVGDGGENLGTSSLSKYGKYAAGGAAIAGGTIAAFKNFGRGTAQGDLAGGAGVAGAIAGVAAIIPGGQLVAGIAAGVSAGLGLISSLIGDPKTNYANRQAVDLRNNAYFAPAALNVMSTTSGTIADRGANGMVRGGSPYSAFDFNQQLGYNSHFENHPLFGDPTNQFTTVPGFVQPYYAAPGQPGIQQQTTPGYQSNPTAPPANVTPPNPPPPVIVNVTQHIQTLDANSFRGIGPQLAAEMKHQLQSHQGLRKEVANVASLRS